MLIRTVVAPFLSTNCYLVAGPERTCVVVDPGGGATTDIAATAKAAGWRIAGVVLTHGHPDHTWSAGAIANRLGVPVWIHAADEAALANPLADNGPLDGVLEDLLAQMGEGPAGFQQPDDVRVVETTPGGNAQVDLAGVGATWVHAPGHTPGSSVLRFDTGLEPSSAVPPVHGGMTVSTSTVLTGDVLFAGSIGRCDLPGGDERTMFTTLRRLATDLAPDALLLPGHGPATTMARELQVNPFLRS